MREIIARLLSSERRIGLQHSGFLNDAAILFHVVFQHSSAHHSLEHFHFFHGEVLDESKVEEGHATVFMKDVVAWMRITVKGAEAIQTAEDKTEDCFPHVVAFFL